MPIKITVPPSELWDEENEKFIRTPERVLTFEHSLVSLSKWEEKFEKPFLSNVKRTNEEAYAYIQMMCLDKNVPEEVFMSMSAENYNAIHDYMESKMTATWFSESKGKPNREVITAEIIYYWMFALKIPLKFETRHLNKLITQIKVINEKNQPAKKMSPRDLAERNHRLNEERRLAMQSRG